MSGVEVVGILLGAFPLAISALEHWRDCAEVMGLWANIKEEYRKTMGEVKDNQLAFRYNLKLLLVPLVNDEILANDDLESLLADPGGPATKWKDHDVDAALAARLAETYERYLEIIDDIQTAMAKLLKVLGHDKPKFQAKLQEAKQLNSSGTNQPQRNLLSKANAQFLKAGVEYEAQRLKFGFGKPKRDDLLKEINGYNDRLEKLLVANDRVAALSEPKGTPRPARATKMLLQYWQHANRIYALIRKSWGCTCQKLHCANLWLQHRTSATIDFRVLLLFEETRSQLQSPWQQQGLQIEWVKDDQSSASICKPAQQPLASASQPATGILLGNGKRRRLYGGVRFGSAPSQIPSVPQIVVHAPTVPPQQSAPSTPHLREIGDLCSEITACTGKPSCLGSLIDRDQGGSYSVFAQPDQRITADAVTLEAVIQGSFKPRLTRVQRYSVALVVASSHLQLHSTPWARKQWDARSISFPRDDADPKKVLFDRPFVPADFSMTASAGAVASTGGSDRSFGSLGIMLVELCFGTPLRDHELWVQLGLVPASATPSLQMMVARQWADAVEGEAGPDYAQAVQWCLNECPTTLKGNQWRQDLARKVVLPLQDCCKWLNPKSSV